MLGPSLILRLIPFNQLLDRASDTLQDVSSDPTSAPVGVNPQCGILRLGHEGSISNVANIAACGVSILVVLVLLFICQRRKAAVGTIPLSLLWWVCIFLTFRGRSLGNSRSTHPISPHSPSSNCYQWITSRARLNCPCRSYRYPRRCRCRIILGSHRQRYCRNAVDRRWDYG